MVYPFLYGSLHTHLHEPVNIVGGSLVIRRLLNQSVNLLLSIFLCGIDIVHLHPLKELLVIYDILLERVANLIDKVYMYIGVVGVYLAATLVNRHEYRLYTTCGLCHEAGGTCRSDGKAGYVAAAVLHHILIELGVGLFQPVDERIGLFPLGIENLEGTTLLSHHY